MPGVATMARGGLAICTSVKPSPLGLCSTIRAAHSLASSKRVQPFAWKAMEYDEFMTSTRWVLPFGAEDGATCSRRAGHGRHQHDDHQRAQQQQEPLLIRIRRVRRLAAARRKAIAAQAVSRYFRRLSKWISNGRPRQKPAEHPHELSKPKAKVAGYMGGRGAGKRENGNPNAETRDHGYVVSDSKSLSSNDQSLGFRNGSCGFPHGHYTPRAAKPLRRDCVRCANKRNGSTARSLRRPSWPFQSDLSTPRRSDLPGHLPWHRPCRRLCRYVPGCGNEVG